MLINIDKNTLSTINGNMVSKTRLMLQCDLCYINYNVIYNNYIKRRNKKQDLCKKCSILGENNPCFRHGKYLFKSNITYYCIENKCDNLVSCGGKRCLSCTNKINMKKYWLNEEKKKEVINNRILRGTFKGEKNTKIISFPYLIFKIFIPIYWVWFF